MRDLQSAADWPAGLTLTEPGDALAQVNNMSRAYRVNLSVLALVALFTGAFLVFSVLSLSVAKRTQQFALLGVLGLSARDRLRLVLWEALALGWLAAQRASRWARHWRRWRCACSAATWAAVTLPAQRRVCNGTVRPRWATARWVWQPPWPVPGGRHARRSVWHRHWP